MIIINILKEIIIISWKIAYAGYMVIEMKQFIS